MFKNWIINKKMRELLLNIPEYPSNNDLSIVVRQLDVLLFPPFKKVKDCVIISDNSIEILEQGIDNAITIHMDKSGYEASNTETQIESFFNEEISLELKIEMALFTVKTWVLQLKNIFPEAIFCFIISSDFDNVLLRFHKVRDDEIGWLVNDLESYEHEAIGYVHL